MWRRFLSRTRQTSLSMLALAALFPIIALAGCSSLLSNAGGPTTGQSSPTATPTRVPTQAPPPVRYVAMGASDAVGVGASNPNTTGYVPILISRLPKGSYALNSTNMAKLSAGDWLIPAAPSAAKIVVKQTKHYGSWKNAVAAVPSFKKANWVTLGPYARWKAEVATPAFRQYLGNQISLDQLSKTLVDGWNNIRG